MNINRHETPSPGRSPASPRSSSQITPSIRQKSNKRVVSSATRHTKRMVKQGADDVGITLDGDTTLNLTYKPPKPVKKQSDLSQMWKRLTPKMKKGQNSTSSPHTRKNPDNSNARNLNHRPKDNGVSITQIRKMTSLSRSNLQSSNDTKVKDDPEKEKQEPRIKNKEYESTSNKGKNNETQQEEDDFNFDTNSYEYKSLPPSDTESESNEILEMEDLDNYTKVVPKRKSKGWKKGNSFRAIAKSLGGNNPTWADKVKNSNNTVNEEVQLISPEFNSEQRYDSDESMSSGNASVFSNNKFSAFMDEDKEEEEEEPEQDIKKGKTAVKRKVQRKKEERKQTAKNAEGRKEADKDTEVSDDEDDEVEITAVIQHSLPKKKSFNSYLESQDEKSETSNSSSGYSSDSSSSGSKKENSESDVSYEGDSLSESNSNLSNCMSIEEEQLLDKDNSVNINNVNPIDVTDDVNKKKAIDKEETISNEAHLELKEGLHYAKSVKNKEAPASRDINMYYSPSKEQQINNKRQKEAVNGVEKNRQQTIENEAVNKKKKEELKIEQRKPIKETKKQQSKNQNPIKQVKKHSSKVTKKNDRVEEEESSVSEQSATTQKAKTKEKSNQLEKTQQTLSWGVKGPPPSHQKPLHKRNYALALQQGAEKEDDINSVNSESTTHCMSKEEAEKEVPPHSIRYQLRVVLNSENTEALEQEFKKSKQKEEIKTIGDILKESITACIEEIKSIDEKAMIISWKESQKFETLSLEKEDFPQTATNITKFFPGYKQSIRNKNKPNSITVKLRIHHPSKKVNEFLESMGNWAGINSMNFKQTILQSQDPAAIGWLAYSTSYTDTNRLHKLLENATGFKWGFGIRPVSNSDSKEDYKKRTKALWAFVDRKNTGKAAKVMSNMFEAKEKSQSSTFSTWFDRFLFLEPERNIPDIYSMRIYKTIIARQKIHSQSIRGLFYTSIEGDIDKRVTIDKEGNKMSLRQMVMAIPSQTAIKLQTEEDPDREPRFQPLFHSLDVTLNSREQWFGNSSGPGGAGHIFSFYEEFTGEAMQNIKGLGIRLLTEYGSSSAITKLFDVDHWEANQGWKFDRDSKNFITQESCMLLQNLLLDPNEAIVKKSDVRRIEEEEKERTQIENNEKKSKIQKKIKGIKKMSKSQRKVKAEYDKAKETLQKSKQAATSISSNGYQMIDTKKILELKKAQIRRSIYEKEEMSIDLKDLSKEGKKERICDSINIKQSDNVSVTSSLTGASASDTPLWNGWDESKPQDMMKNQPKRGTNESVASATSSIKSFNKIFLKNILNDPEFATKEEAINAAQKLLEHQVRKAMLEGRNMISKMMEIDSVDTTSIKEEEHQKINHHDADNVCRKKGKLLIPTSPTPPNKNSQPESMEWSGDSNTGSLT